MHTMLAKPFSLEDAKEICEDFEDLIDTELIFDGVLYMVEDVTVCPFHASEKEAFFASYEIGQRGQDDSHHADEEAFDVTLVVTNLEKEDDGLFFIGIRQYIADKGVNYNFP